MKILENIPDISLEEITADIFEITAETHENNITYKQINILTTLIDLTTLDATDTNTSVLALCEKAVSLNQYGLPQVAAICVYPSFVKTVKAALEGTDIKTASVAGAFPSGQTSIEVKLAEVKYAIEQGADEIDMVISRGKFLEGNYQEVFDEIAAIRECCANQTLKVILETGELGSVNNIYKASLLAINAGADFIKTSTGKIPFGASTTSIYVMLMAVREHFLKTRKMIGIKAAGGVSEILQALTYCALTEHFLGEEYLNSKYMRIGASRLLDKIIEEHKKNG
ncbi:MAG: deoxyribose-phosphate aldolase [Bacteroidota bacterium]